MKQYQPTYMHEFHCIADRCRDSCCIGWEISIDDQTAASYDKIGGSFGNRLKAAMTKDSPRCFYTDEHERCPFLNEKNLCDIIMEMGEQSLCQICTDHPRFYNWYPDRKECGLGLCCEEAARLILTQPMILSESEIPSETAGTFDLQLLECLRNARDIIILQLQDKTQPLYLQLSRLVIFTHNLQLGADNGDLTLPEWKYTATDSPCTPWNASELPEFLSSLEAMDKNWHPYLQDCIKHMPEIQNELETFRRQFPQCENYLRNIAVYFIWRYFTNGAAEGEFLSYSKLTAAAVVLCECFFCYDWLQGMAPEIQHCADLTKQFSKEIEYAEENLNALLDATYTLPTLETISFAKALHALHQYK